MKVLVLFGLLLNVLCNGIIEESSQRVLSMALDNVTRHLFQLETRMFVIYYGASSSTMWLSQDLNEKLMPFTLLQKDLSEKEEVRLNSSALLTFNSFENLREFNNNLTMTSEFYKPLQLFIFCENASSKDIESLASDVSARDEKRVFGTNIRTGPRSGVNIYHKMGYTDVIQYEYFLVAETKAIKLMTFVWFSPGKCAKLHLITINKFTKRTAQWDNENFSFDKLANFHGCEIKAHSPTYPVGSNIQFHIPVVLQTHLNYKLSYWSMNESNEDAYIDISIAKACYNGYDGNMYHGKTSIHRNKPVLIRMNFITQPVEFSPVNMAVPPSGNYSEYEKLRMPFDDYVWALIAFTFVAAFTTILVLYCVPRTIRDFVIGSNVTTPTLNVAQIFFGIAQVAVPRRNFSRFLTMVFILYSLIIRTAWQGKTYEFMQKNISKPEVQTVEEMIDEGYTFYMESTFVTKFPDSEIAKRITPVDFGSNYKTVCEGILDPTFRGVMQVDSGDREILAQQTFGLFLRRIRKEVLYVNVCGLRFFFHHHFMGIFDRKLQQLFTGGIAPLKDSGSLFYLNNFKLTEKHFKHLYVVEPKVLTLKMLEPGFVIWSASLTFAILAFMGEWLTTLRDFLVVKFVLLAFYRSKKRQHKNTLAALILLKTKRKQSLFGSVVINLKDDQLEDFKKTDFETQRNESISVADSDSLLEILKIE